MQKARVVNTLDKDYIIAQDMSVGAVARGEGPQYVRIPKSAFEGHRVMEDCFISYRIWDDENGTRYEVVSVSKL